MVNREAFQRVAKKFVGEFVVIVLGVLVALAVSQYVEDAQERRLEFGSLERVSAEVQQTIESIRSMERRFHRAAIATRYLDSLLSVPGVSRPSGSTLYLATQRASNWSIPTYFRATLDEMESTGGLRLLRDPMLRRDILAFYQLERTHAVLWDRMDLRFRTLARGLQYPSSDTRFVDACPPEVHPAACKIDVPGIDAAALWSDLNGTPAVRSMLRNSIRDFVRAGELLRPQAARGDSLNARIQRALAR